MRVPNGQGSNITCGLKRSEGWGPVGAGPGPGQWKTKVGQAQSLAHKAIGWADPESTIVGSSSRSENLSNGNALRLACDGTPSLPLNTV